MLSIDGSILRFSSELYSFVKLDWRSFCLRWFKLCRRKSKGYLIQNNHYIVIDLIRKIENEFEIYCENSESEIYGSQKLREQFAQIYFEKQKSKKRKRSNSNSNLSNDLPRGHTIPIHGIGFDTFQNLSQKIKNIRTNNKNLNLNLKLKNGIIHFFSLFNEQFQNDILNIEEITNIKCQPVTEEFNTTYGFHGPPGRDVAFIFEVKLVNGTTNLNHYCLGNMCQYGCSVSAFKI